MNKQELIDTMATAADISKKSAQVALDAFIQAVTDALMKGDDVSLVGFGSFTTSKRAERTGRNPQTGQTMTIPGSTVPRFRVGKKLKDAVNQ